MTKFGYPPSGPVKDPVRGSNQASGSLPAKSGPSPAGTLTYRKTEKEKKWPLKAWDTDDTPDDGIVAWMKKKSVLESKRGSKHHSPIIDTEYYFPLKHQCSSIEDPELFIGQSLHNALKPKQKYTKNKHAGNADTKVPPVTYKYTKSSGIADGDTVGVITPAGYEERDNVNNDKDLVEQNIDTYRDFKHLGAKYNPNRRRSRSAEDINKRQRERLDQRSLTYNKIRRLLKFSSLDRKSGRFSDDEDEGYSSKTSSAEVKGDIDESGNGEKPEKDRMFSSMIDLSELPSNGRTGDDRNNSNVSNSNNKAKETEVARIKFSYTHQAPIFQIPSVDMKLTHDSRVQRTDKQPTKDENGSYSKLKRNKELNKCNKLDQPQSTPPTESTMYNIDTMKPMTLVLRKISIQDSEQHVTSVLPSGNWTCQDNIGSAASQSTSRVSSAVSRAESIASQICSARSRAGSALSRTSSVMSQTDRPSRLRHKYNHNAHTSPRVVINCGTNVANLENSHEPTWSQKYSHIERQASSYCIGDLLPAVDRSIYTTQFVKGKLGKDHSKKPTTDGRQSYTPVADGFSLLKKGMDLLTGSADQKEYNQYSKYLNTAYRNKKQTLPTLGPPPFRPNQSRHPLKRNVTIVVNSKQDVFSYHNPLQGGSKGGPGTPRAGSDKGPRPVMSPDKETQKKLKEAFTKFYQNRPKDIGKEFRRMQTMWKA